MNFSFSRSKEMRMQILRDFHSNQYTSIPNKIYDETVGWNALHVIASTGDWDDDDEMLKHRLEKYKPILISMTFEELTRLSTVKDKVTANKKYPEGRTPYDVAENFTTSTAFKEMLDSIIAEKRVGAEAKKEPVVQATKAKGSCDTTTKPPALPNMVPALAPAPPSNPPAVQPVTQQTGKPPVVSPP